MDEHTPEAGGLWSNRTDTNFPQNNAPCGRLLFGLLDAACWRLLDDAEQLEKAYRDSASANSTVHGSWWLPLSEGFMIDRVR